jgi:hypothetical protein
MLESILIRMSSDLEIASQLQDFIVHNEAAVVGEILAANYPVPEFVRVNGKKIVELTLDQDGVKERVKADLARISIEEALLKPIAMDETPTQAGIVSLFSSIVYALLNYLEETETIIAIIQKDEAKAKVLASAIAKLDDAYPRKKEDLDETDLAYFKSHASEEQIARLEREFTSIDKTLKEKTGEQPLFGEIRKARTKKSTELAKSVVNKLYTQAQTLQVIKPKIPSQGQPYNF